MKDDPFHGAPALSGSRFEDLLASLSPQLFFKGAPPRSHAAFSWRSDIVVGQGVSVWRTQYSCDWSFASDIGQEDLAIGFLNAGCGEMRVGAKSARRTPTNVALVPLSILENYQVRAIDGMYASVMLKFDASLVARVLAARFDGARLSKLDLAPIIDLSTGTGQTLRLMARTLVSGMHDDQVRSRSPKAVALLAEAALRLIFDNVPHRLTGRLDRRPQCAAPKRIQQAIDYMHANLHHTLTMTDIAEAVGVSPRALQLGFRKACDSTPAAYLRMIRLEAVRTELLRPENRLPVHEVALKWGFAHMGHFSAQYRKLFGVYPSETAKRRLA